ncbi:hypothetical protein DVR12_19435 [Chitinophaga silvatica]|uniref:DUF4134 domain-containing protein n=1 Tax=Chitinophaga silvatica TaxID=2282649 RepID=A0A3E1Y720_9BACT|nr:hypothetical protein [Chitinophaga silvatica]RFS20732.1 hypothetical protein DVR12_19435 [Chitinophaga silvatica]
MKQAKFALAATTVLAIIGGAIAFKGETTKTIYTKANNATTYCSVLLGTGFITGVGTMYSFASVVAGSCNYKLFISKLE